MSLNKVLLIGRLGKDPEVRFTASNMAIANFSIATNESRKNPQSGAWEEYAEWHNIVAFGKSAEFAQKFLKKGSQIFCDGKIQTRKWQDKEGKDRYTTEVVANEFRFVGSKGDSAGRIETSVEETMGEPSTNSKSLIDSLPSADAMKKSSPTTAKAAASFEDDDIPF